MRRLILLAALATLGAAQYRYEFPRDHFDHPAYPTEWWYYTGNVHAADGHRYGFELVFFRHAQPNADGDSGNRSLWRADNLYLAHLALTDIDGQRFRSWRRVNRAGPGVAGASREEGRVWNGNWQVAWDKTSSVQTLNAVADGIRLTLRCTPGKGPVVHQVKEQYVSLTRLAVEGAINGQGVSGSAWMDHEWFSGMLEPGQVGWDWFSVQLEDGTEFMLFRIRRADGASDARSAGTFIDRAGRATPLGRGDFELRPLEYWTSPRTGARYPVKWHVSVPSRHLDVECRAALPDQELAAEKAGEPTYWEGAAAYSGTSRGVGYLEMTGYAQALHM